MQVTQPSIVVLYLVYFRIEALLFVYNLCPRVESLIRLRTNWYEPPVVISVELIPAAVEQQFAFCRLGIHIVFLYAPIHQRVALHSIPEVLKPLAASRFALFQTSSVCKSV